MAEQPLTDAEIRALRSLLKGISVPEWRALKAIASGVVRMGAGSAAADGGPREATDAELMGRFGDPKVRKDPKRWAGEGSYAGARYSQCPSDYLYILAELLEWGASKDKEKGEAAGKNNSGKLWWQVNLEQAALARGWARRNRGKNLPPPAANGHGSESGDDGRGDAYEGPTGEDEEWVPT